MNIYYVTGKNNTEHAVRGIGTYTTQLIGHIKGISGVKVRSGEALTKRDDEWADIVHYTWVDLFSRSFHKAETATTIVTIHDVIPLVFPRHFPRGVRGSINLWFQKKKIRNADAIITDSYASKNDVNRYLSVDSSRIYPIALAPDDNLKPVHKKKKQEIKKKYNISGKYILYVGDINWNKNITTLLLAFSILLQKSLEEKGKPLYLVLAGSAFLNTSTQESQAISHQIIDLGIEQYVVKTGYISYEELNAFYSGAAVYVQPSFYEGFGLPVLEAMASATPVVASHAGSLPEVVGDAGLLVDPESVDSVVDGVSTVLSYSPSKRASVVKKGLAHAKRFTWKKTAKETYQVYKKFI